MKKSGRPVKYIFITGGVVSSLGKGVAAASIGHLLEARGLRITFLKLDPYINIDPGTMNPYQHGEVFVTNDGAETDLDLGHYERFTSLTLTRANNCTAGKIYHNVLSRERRGDYLGGTVQVVPHITQEIKGAICALAQKESADRPDVIIVEIGGTVGDIESLPFLEAIRPFPFEVGRENVLYILLTLVPYIRAAGELKTKPTQHSVNKMREIGIQPDILLCRTEQLLDAAIKAKIALFCNVAPDAVINAQDVDCIFEIPLLFHKEGLDALIVQRLGLRTRAPRLSSWTKMVDRVQHPKQRVRIAFVGKYVELKDAYKSLHEALIHSGIARGAKVEIDWINSEQIEGDPARFLKGCGGILVASGFGMRGIEGKIAACRYARENAIPFLGICLGMQCAVIEFARSRAGLSKANSTEFDEQSTHPVIHLLPGQKKDGDKGGTMRLGAYPCRLAEGSRAREAYGRDEVSERHRHRYEFNNRYRDRLTRAGLLISGTSPDGKLVEIIEVADHPWFVAVQFHPEFQSAPQRPHPLFSGFIGAVVARSGEPAA